MENSKIIGIFVGGAVLIWLAVAAAILIFPALGFQAGLAMAFVLHPTIIILAALPLAMRYATTCDLPVTHARGLKLAVIALILLLPLSIVSESLNAHLLISGLGIDGLLEDGQRNYVILSYRSLALTAFGTFLGLGYLFPVQVRLRHRQRGLSA